MDDFEGVYRRVKQLGLLDSDTHGAALREHPTGWVQMYIRDPAGNLVEIDWPDVTTLDRSVVADIRQLDDDVSRRRSRRRRRSIRALAGRATGRE